MASPTILKSGTAPITCIAPGGGVTVDVPVQIGSLFGIPAQTAAVGVSFELQTDCQAYLPKQAALAITLGADVYWDNGAGEADTTSSNTFVGKCALAAAGGDTTVLVKLTPGLTTAAGGVAASLYDANTILKADTDNTPEALTVAEQTLVGRITGGEITALTATQTRTLLNVEDGADVTDAANVNAAGAVMESDYNANTVMAATLDNTPLPLTMGASTVLARLAAGDIVAATPTEIRTLINVENGADVTDATNVNAAGAVMESDFNAFTILAADVDNTPTALTLGASTIPARLAAGGIVAATTTEIRTLLNVESGADVTDETNVLAALAVGATAKNMGGGAITNVGLIDGRDVSADGTALDAAVLDVAEIGAENTDGHMAIPYARGLAEAGTWTPSITGDGLVIVTRSAGAATEEFWIDVPVPARSTASKGIKPTGLVANYSVGTADATDVRFELWKKTLAADNASPTAAIIVGSLDADYDADHNTAVKRGDDTGAPELHRATVTDAAGAAYLGANEQLLVRVVVQDPGTSVFILRGLELLYSETQVDLI